MTGYGLTVFSGFKVERFKVKVIDVLRRFLPNQDLILIRAEHPVLTKTGVVGGMSGSPIYIQGKLAGALAYGWRFSKEPIAGVTPIANMVDLLKRKPRGPDRTAFASADRSRTGRDALAALPRSSERWWKLPFPRPPRRAASALTPVAVPLNAAGFSPRAMKLLRDSFSAYGFEPVQGGGTGKAAGPSRFEKGGAIGVQLVSGDMALTGTGTVTWTDARRVLGFGHRLFNAGEIYLPAVTARINHTLASLARSFKLSSPARIIGALIQDRQEGIMVDTGKKIGVIPMTVTMRSPGSERVFRTRLAHHRLLTPNLATTVFSSAMSQAMSDITHTTMKVTTRISVKGHPQIVVEDYMYSSSGARLVAVLFSRGLRVLRRVMNNKYEPTLVERIDVVLDAKFTRDVVEITGVSVSSSHVNPGDRININVSFKPFAGPEFNKSFPLKIPRTMAGTVLMAEVASGMKVRPDLAPPQNLKQYIKNLTAGYPARSVVISLMIPTLGVKVRGRVIRDLPLSVIDALNTGTQIRDDKVFKTSIRKVQGTSRIVLGKMGIRIRVKSEVE